MRTTKQTTAETLGGVGYMYNYDYREQETNDVIDAITENYSKMEIAEKLQDRQNFADELYDQLWIDDSVTGNASGSYTFNTCKAHEYVDDNSDLLREALDSFGEEADTIAEKFLNEEYEYFDVTIRCYLLGECIEAALDELETDPEIEKAIEELEKMEA